MPQLSTLKKGGGALYSPKKTTEFYGLKTEDKKKDETQRV